LGNVKVLGIHEGEELRNFVKGLKNLILDYGMNEEKFFGMEASLRNSYVNARAFYIASFLEKHRTGTGHFPELVGEDFMQVVDFGFALGLTIATNCHEFEAFMAEQVAKYGFIEEDEGGE